MAKAPKQTDPKKPDVEEKSTFTVSVMPKEFREREGLARAYVAQGVAEAPPKRPAVKPKPAPKPVEKITPQAAREAKLVKPPAKKKREIPWGLIIGGIVVLVVLGGLAIWALSTLDSEPDIDREAPPAVPVVVEPEEPEEPDEPVVPEEPEEPDEPDPFEDVVLPGQDTDSDGLTDVEEVLYGTQSTRPDTDSDGYLDGNEVFHLYHPDGYAPQTLLDTGAVSVIEPAMDYQVNVISSWTHQVNAEQNSLITSSASGESFQVIELPISVAESINEWYARSVPILDQQQLEAFRTKQGFMGAWTKDHLTAYVRFGDNRLLVFTYNLGSANRVQYRQTFEMLINSLVKTQE